MFMILGMIIGLIIAFITIITNAVSFAGFTMLHVLFLCYFISFVYLSLGGGLGALMDLIVDLIKYK